MTSSIARRLILWLAIPVTLLSLLGALVDYSINVVPQLTAEEQRLIDTARTIAGHLNAASAAVIPTEVTSELPRGTRFAVRDAAARVITGDASLPTLSLINTEQQFVQKRVDSQELSLLTIRLPSAIGSVDVTVAKPVDTSPSAIRTSLRRTVLWDLIQLSGFLALVWIGVRLGLRPFERLQQQIASRSPLDLREISIANLPTEIQPIAVTLNDLLTRLNRVVQDQRQFIADTAHQLRTPLTGILAQVQLIALEPSAASLRDKLKLIEEAVVRLTHSTNQLLALARAESANQAPIRATTVDLQTIVHEAVSKFVDRALQLNIDLGVDAQSSLVLADRSLLYDMLVNLLDNAIKYSPSETRITVKCGETNNRPFLAVEDNGQGIASEELPLIRRRFYRTPGAAVHGSGLGLAIVDQIAKSHGATLTITSKGIGLGTTVRVDFPTQSRFET